MSTQPPELVAAAERRASAAGFAMSSERPVGQLLAVLAGSVRRGGRILEMGTGVGVGLAWIVEGLTGRTDVEVISIELDPATARLAAAARWPAFVRLLVGDVLSSYDELGRFNLIFADAQDGKWESLDRTVAALQPGGLLLVDDMAPAEWSSAEHEANTAQVREYLLGHPELTCVEQHWSSGVILCSRRSPS